MEPQPLRKSFLRDELKEVPLEQRTISSHISYEKKAPSSTLRSDAYDLLDNDLPTRARKQTLLEKIEQFPAGEPLGLLFSAAALIAIVVILKMHNGQLVPQWRVSLNSVISWLSTVARIGALYSAARGISQLKWTWFAEKKHGLVDFRIFDAGSRGITGALEILVRLKASLATFGAAAIILRVAFDPFVQNLIHFYDGVVIDESQVAHLARTEVYRSLGPAYSYDSYGLDPALKASVYSAIFHSTQVGISLPLNTCASGNCTWDRFYTFAFCPKCVDVSEHLDRKCKSLDSSQYQQMCNVSFPDGSPYITFDATKGEGSFDSTFFQVKKLEGEAVSLKNITESPFPIYQALKAMVNISAVGQTTGRHALNKDSVIIGTECAMLPCIQNIEASVRNGLYEEKVVDTWFDRDQERSKNGTIVFSTQSGKGRMFGMTDQVDQALRFPNVLDQVLIGNVSDADSATAIYSSSDTVEAMFYAQFSDTNCNTPNNTFACVFNAVGRALTKAVRDASMPTNGSRTLDVALGRTEVTTTFVRVEWQWLSLPVAVWICSFIVWLGSMLKTWKIGVPLWRDNVLPLLYLYREEGGSSADDGYGHSNFGYEVRAEGSRVKLTTHDGHWKLRRQWPERNVTVINWI